MELFLYPRASFIFIIFPLCCTSQTLESQLSLPPPSPASVSSPLIFILSLRNPYSLHQQYNLCDQINASLYFLSTFLIIYNFSRNPFCYIIHIHIIFIAIMQLLYITMNAEKIPTSQFPVECATMQHCNNNRLSFWFLSLRYCQALCYALKIHYILFLDWWVKAVLYGQLK